MRSLLVALLAVACSRDRPVEHAPAPTARPTTTARDPIDDAVQSARKKLAGGDEAGAMLALDQLQARIPEGARRLADACELATLLNNRSPRLFPTDPRAAENDSRRAFALCPTNALLAGNLGRVLLSRAAAEDRGSADGRQRARAYLEEVVKIDAKNADAQAYLGELLFADDDPKGAAEHLRAAAALRPTDTALAARLLDVEKKASVEGAFRDNKHNHFVARFEGYAQERLAWTALDLLEQAYFSIGAKLNVYPKDPITVVIYTGDQYKQVVNVPDWTAGSFDGKIRIREGSLLAAQGELERMLRHEYTHAVLATLHTELPAWVNEGLAMHFEGADGDAATRSCARAKADGKLLRFDQVQSTFVGIQDPDAAQVAYAMATSLVSSLVDRRGEYALQTLASRLQTGESFENAFQATYAVDVRHHYDSWADSL